MISTRIPRMIINDPAVTTRAISKLRTLDTPDGVDSSFSCASSHTDGTAPAPLRPAAWPVSAEPPLAPLPELRCVAASVGNRIREPAVSENCQRDSHSDDRSGCRQSTRAYGTVVDLAAELHQGCDTYPHGTRRPGRHPENDGRNGHTSTIRRSLSCTSLHASGVSVPRAHCGDDHPSRPLLAYRSAASFPTSPLCPATRTKPKGRRRQPSPQPDEQEPH